MKKQKLQNINFNRISQCPLIQYKISAQKVKFFTNNYFGHGAWTPLQCMSLLFVEKKFGFDQEAQSLSKILRFP